jgi:hypothetical protein
MTTTVTVQSHNYPVHVQVLDHWKDENDKPHAHTVEDRILWPEDGVVMFYSTTTRSVRAVDLDYEDERAKADRAARFPTETATVEVVRDESEGANS